jgi:hypothetical protein
MHFINTKSFLLFSVATSSLYSAAVGSECDTFGANVLFGGDCIVTDGSDQCPALCQSSLNEFLTVCGAEGATFHGDPPDTVQLLLIADNFIEPPCEETLHKTIIAESDDTCQGWGILHLSTAALSCSQDTMCSQFCKDIQDGFYSTCASDDEIMIPATDGSPAYYNSASLLESIAEVFLSESCKEYAGDQTFSSSTAGGKSSSSALSVSNISVILSLVVSSFYLFA